MDDVQVCEGTPRGEEEMSSGGDMLLLETGLLSSFRGKKYI